MSHGLSGLVHTVVRGFPVDNPHLKKRQEDWIVNLGSVHLSKPFCPSDHVGPKPIIEEEVWIHIMPPLVVGSDCIFYSFHDSMEGILGDLSFSISISSSRNKEGNTSKVDG